MRAAMDMTFARGPVVAASKGIAVEANHQSWGSSSSLGLSLNFHRCLVCVRVGARGSNFSTSFARGAEVLDDWESEPLIFPCHDRDACPDILALLEANPTAYPWIMKMLADALDVVSLRGSDRNRMRYRKGGRGVWERSKLGQLCGPDSGHETKNTQSRISSSTDRISMQKANSMEPWQMSVIGGQDQPSGILSYLHIRP